MDYIIWNVSPELFHIGPISVRWYGLLFALGFIVGYELMTRIFKIEKKRLKDMEALTVIMVLSTVIGARLGHCFFYEPEYYLANPLEILKPWQGGLASHGAAIGIVIGLWIFIRKRREEYTFLWIMDRIVITVALAGTFIRLGNFFNSEILGSPADLPWAIIFERVDMIPRHPSQLYEAISYLIIFFILGFSYLKKKVSIEPGKLFGMFLTLIFGARFVIEFFKERQTDFEIGMPMHMGQLLSIPLVLIGIYLWIRAYCLKKKN
jgi:prolipoprotein diacylglyceryl transferase